MKKISISILFIVLCCTISKAQSDTVNILVDNSVDNVGLNFYYLNECYYGHPVSVNASLGKKIVIKRPMFLIQSNKNQTPYFIYPGETIHIKQTKEGNTYLYIPGNNRRNEELNIFSSLINKDEIFYTPILKDIPYLKNKAKNMDQFKVYRAEIESLKTRRTGILYKAMEDGKISDSFYYEAQNLIQSSYWNSRLLLCWRNRSLLKNMHQYNKYISETKDSIKSIPFSFNYMNYRMYSNCLGVLLGEFNDFLINEIPQDSFDLEKRIRYIYNSDFGDSVKVFLSASNIYKGLIMKSFNVSANTINNFLQSCTIPLYKDVIEKVSNSTTAKSQFIENKSDNLIDTNGEKIGINSLFESYKGKLVYVDFWASWCTPCRAEMPYSKKLKLEYAEKNIAFCYISIDNIPSDWEIADKEESLNNSYLLLNSAKSLFAQKINLNTIPRYILLDKEGKILILDAPRPSDPKLKVLIDKFL